MSYGIGGGSPGGLPPMASYPPPVPAPPSPPWYRQAGWIVALLILFAPVGIFLAWRYTTWPKAAKVVASVACGLLFVAMIAGASHPKKKAPVAAAAAHVSSAAPSPAVPSAPEPVTRSAPAPLPSTTQAPGTVVPTPVPSGTQHPTPAPAPRTTAPDTPQEAPAPPAQDPPETQVPAASPTMQGVHPGAFCSEHDDYGYTVDGTLMQCTTTATDFRYRWRAG